MTANTFICACTRSPRIQIARSLLEASIFGERSDPSRIFEYANPPRTSVISVPGLALADRVLKIQMAATKHKGEGSLIFYSCSKRM